MYDDDLGGIHPICGGLGSIFDLRIPKGQRDFSVAITRKCSIAIFCALNESISVRFGLQSEC